MVRSKLESRRGIRGGREGVTRLGKNVKLTGHLLSVGEAKTPLVRLASATHQQLTKEEKAATGVMLESIAFAWVSKTVRRSRPT